MTVLLCPRIGSCERYNNGSEVCSGILAGKYVYLQEGTTQNELDSQLDSTSNIFGVATEECRQFVSEILCNTYYSPCGTEDARITPVTICPKECGTIATSEACSSTWSLAMSTLASEGLPVIDCSNLAGFLPPVATCCIGIDMIGKPCLSCSHSTLRLQDPSPVQLPVSVIILLVLERKLSIVSMLVRMQWDALMGMFVWLMEYRKPTAELSCVRMESGVVCVTTCGTLGMLQLYAVNWDLVVLKVCMVCAK